MRFHFKIQGQIIRDAIVPLHMQHPWLHQGHNITAENSNGVISHAVHRLRKGLLELQNVIGFLGTRINGFPYTTIKILVATLSILRQLTKA